MGLQETQERGPFRSPRQRDEEPDPGWAKCYLAMWQFSISSLDVAGNNKREMGPQPDPPPSNSIDAGGAKSQGGLLRRQEPSALAPRTAHRSLPSAFDWATLSRQTGEWGNMLPWAPTRQDLRRRRFLEGPRLSERLEFVQRDDSIGHRRRRLEPRLWAQLGSKGALSET